MRALASAGAGFLLAVLWFDLMFDVQMVGHGGREAPEPVLASIAAYYRRVTTAARPMNLLIAAAMALTLAAVLVEIAAADYAPWTRWLSLALLLPPLVLARAHTVPCAVRLGARTSSPAEQSAAARAILRDHLFCFAAIAALLVVQLVA